MAAWFPVNLIHLITAAIRDASKLTAALVSSGVFLVASALALIISKGPGAVLVTWHASAAIYTYYSVLAGMVAFGLVEATFGFWVLPRDPPRWNMAAKVLLYVTLLPLAVVVALWAGLRL